MFIALIVVASLVGCYLALGLEVAFVLHLFNGKQADLEEIIEEIVGWPFVLTAYIVMYILRYFNLLQPRAESLSRRLP